jgi:hypothetical protein
VQKDILDMDDVGELAPSFNQTFRLVRRHDPSRKKLRERQEREASRAVSISNPSLIVTTTNEKRIRSSSLSSVPAKRPRKEGPPRCQNAYAHQTDPQTLLIPTTLARAQNPRGAKHKKNCWRIS